MIDRKQAKEFSDLVSPKGRLAFATARGDKWIERMDEREKIYRITPDPETSHYVSLGRFVGKSRKAAMAGVQAILIDLDLEQNGITKSRALAEISTRFAECPPSLIVDSGRGIHLYWVHDQVWGKMLVPWQKLAREFHERLADLGSDPAVAGDAARVIRIPGTYNPKSRTMCRIIGGTREPALTIWKRKKSKREIDLWKARLRDTTALIEHRYGGKVPEGMRTNFAFVIANAMIHLSQTGEATEMVCRLTGWSVEYTTKFIAGISKNTDTFGYLMTNQHIFDRLRVTVEEVSELGIKSLVPVELRKTIKRKRKTLTPEERAARRRAKNESRREYARIYMRNKRAAARAAKAGLPPPEPEIIKETREVSPPAASASPVGGASYNLAEPKADNATGKPSIIAQTPEMKAFGKAIQRVIREMSARGRVYRPGRKGPKGESPCFSEKNHHIMACHPNKDGGTEGDRNGSVPSSHGNPGGAANAPDPGIHTPP